MSYCWAAMGWSGTPALGFPICKVGITQRIPSVGCGSHKSCLEHEKGEVSLLGSSPSPFTSQLLNKYI